MTVREAVARLFGAFRRSEQELTTVEEMRFHLEMAVDDGVRRGLPREEAERQARIRFGTVETSIESVRDQRGLGWLDAAATDIAHAWSGLHRHPGFMAIAGAVLASAVIVNTLVFTLAYGVLVRPLPYPDPERLVRIYEQSASQPKFPLSIYNYLEDRRANRTLEGIALYTAADMQLVHDDRAETVTAVAITDDFFPVLGVSPALGRNFNHGEMIRGSRVIILSDAFWRNGFHADPTVIGKTLRLDRDQWTVIGVAGPDFQHVGGEYRSPLQGTTVDIWRPLPLDISDGCDKGCHYTNAIARIRPGVTVAVARDDLNSIMEDLARRFPDDYQGRRARLEPLAQEVVGKSRATVLIVLTAGALVLLLASVNVAGLSVARVLVRRREMAVRRALGGTSWRVMRAVVAENVVLGALAGLTGLVVAAAVLPFGRLLLPQDFPRLHEVIFRWPVGVFAFVAALGASLVSGVIAASVQAGGDPSEALYQESRTSSESHGAGRLRGILVGAEVALACLLAFSAILLLRSSRLIESREHGFRPDRVLTFQLALPGKAYSEPPRVAAFYAEAARKLRELSGVLAAGFSTSLPWTGYDENSDFGIVGYTPKPGESISARYQGADPGFFDAIGMRVIRGRSIEPGDRKESAPVLVVNEALVRRYFGNTEPVGRMLDVWGSKRRVIGVVADVRDTPSDPAAVPAFWMPLAQVQFTQVRAAVRTEGDPQRIVSAVRSTFAELDRELPLAEVRTMDKIAAAALAQRRFALWLCESFALLSLALAAAGVYAMLSYSVQQRRREFGIRVALGATRGNVLASVFARGAVTAIGGVVAGSLLAPAAGRALSALLFGVTPADPSSLASAALLILVIAALGSAAPGWSAARAEPVSSLREQ